MRTSARRAFLIGLLLLLGALVQGVAAAADAGPSFSSAPFEALLLDDPARVAAPDRIAAAAEACGTAVPAAAAGCGGRDAGDCGEAFEDHGPDDTPLPAPVHEIAHPLLPNGLVAVHAAAAYSVALRGEPRPPDA